MMSGESAGCQELSSPAGRFAFLLLLFSRVSVLVSFIPSEDEYVQLLGAAADNMYV